MGRNATKLVSYDIEFVANNPGKWLFHTTFPLGAGGRQHPERHRDGDGPTVEEGGASEQVAPSSTTGCRTLRLCGQVGVRRHLKHTESTR